MPDLVLLPVQRRLWECQARHILNVAGVGSGKTRGGAIWCLKQISEQPYAKGFIGAQSYQQLSRVSMPAMLSLLDNVGLEYRFNKAPPESWGPSRFPDHERILSVKLPGITLPCQIQTGTMDNYQAHRGIDCGWFWLDESRESAVEAFDIMQSRLRGQPAGTVYRSLNTTTPNGFSWLYRKFVAEPIPDSAVIRASTTENIFLPPEFVSNLRAQYTSQFAKQEIDGEWLNLTSGQAYHAFKRTDNVAAVRLDPARVMFYSMDWNISPLCAVYGQHDAIRADIASEIYIQGSGRTADAAEEFCRRLADHKNKRVVIYGDMSGANRDTRQDSTDYDILERVMKSKGWATEIRRNYQNPPFIESIEAVNASFEHMRTTIDPSCKRLITDLEQVAWKEGTRVLDKSNKDLTHLSDALRYFLFKEFAPSQKASSSDILN